MKRFFYFFSLLLSLVIFTNCEKQEEDTIHYQAFDLDSNLLHPTSLHIEIEGVDGLEFSVTKNVEYSGNLIRFEFNLLSPDSSIAFGLKEDYRNNILVVGDEIGPETELQWTSDFYIVMTFNLTEYTEDEFDNYFPPKYWGLRMKKGNKTYYGWFALKKLQLTEIATCSIQDRPILIGDTE